MSRFLKVYLAVATAIFLLGAFLAFDSDAADWHDRPAGQVGAQVVTAPAPGQWVFLDDFSENSFLTTSACGATSAALFNADVTATTPGDRVIAIRWCTERSVSTCGSTLALMKDVATSNLQDNPDALYDFVTPVLGVIPQSGSDTARLAFYCGR